MPNVIRTCSECGKTLGAQDRYCPSCGAKCGAQEKAPVSTSVLPCSVCGHRNVGSGNFCEECGSPLPQTVDEGSAKTRRASPKFERWHVAAGLAVFLLAGVFLYLELQRNVAAPPSNHVHADVSGSSAAIIREIEQLQQTVDANPGDVGSLLRLANLFHDHAMSDPRILSRAVETYTKYLRLVPGDPDARVDLGICYFEMGRVDTLRSAGFYTQAVEQMTNVTQSHPKHQPAAFNLGIVHLHAGNIQESNRWFKKAVEIDPSSTLGLRAADILTQHTFQ